MRRTVRIVVPLLALLLAAGHDLPRFRAADRPAGKIADVRRGMSADAVRNLIGPPQQTVRQILFRRHVEQWVYEEPNAGRVELNCPRGEEPYVLTVHTNP